MSDVLWGRCMARGICRGVYPLAVLGLFLLQNAGVRSAAVVRQEQVSRSGVITAVQQDGKASFILPLKLVPNVSGEVVKSVTISEEDKDILTGYKVSPFKLGADGSTKLDIVFDFFGLPGEVKFAVTVRTSSNATYKIEPTFGVIGLAIYEDLRDSQGKLRMFTGPKAEVLNIPPNGKVLEVSGRAFAGTSGVPRASIWFDSAIEDIPWDDDECDSLVDLRTERKASCSMSFKSPETEVFQIRSRKEKANAADAESFDIVWFGVAKAVRGAGLDPESELNDPRVGVKVQEAELDPANTALIRAGIWCTLIAIGLLFTSLLCCFYACKKSATEYSMSSRRSTSSDEEIFKAESRGVNPNAYTSNSVDGDDSGQWENVKEADDNETSASFGGQPMAKYAFREGTGDDLVDESHKKTHSQSAASPGHPFLSITMRSATTDSTTDPYTSKATSDGYNAVFATSKRSLETKSRTIPLEDRPAANPVGPTSQSTPPDRRTTALFESANPTRAKRNGRPPEYPRVRPRVRGGRASGNLLILRNPESPRQLSQSNSASSNTTSEFTESTWSSAEFTNGGDTTATTSASYGASSAREESKGNDHDGYATHDLQLESTTYGSPPSAQSGHIGVQDRRQTDTLWSERSSSSERESSNSAEIEGRDAVSYHVPHHDDSSREVLRVTNVFSDSVTRERISSERIYDDGRYGGAVDPLRSSPVSTGFAHDGAMATAAPNWTERWSRAVVDKFRVRRQARNEVRRERISPMPRDGEQNFPGHGSHFVVASPQSSLAMADILQDFPWGTHRTSDSESGTFQGYRR